MPKVGMEPIRRNQVMEAVLGIIASEGMDGVTLDKAAKAAGVSKGVVSYYFANKESLMQESCRAFLESYTLGIQSLIGMGIEGRHILRIIAYAVLGRHDAMAAMEELVSQAYSEDQPQSLSPGEEAPGFSLDASEQQAVIMQIFSRMSHDAVFKALMKAVYADYSNVIGTTMNIIIGSDGSMADVLTLQYMAILDGLMLYNVMEFRTDQALDVVERFIDGLPDISR